MGIPSPAQYAEGELTIPSQTAPAIGSKSLIPAVPNGVSWIFVHLGLSFFFYSKSLLLPAYLCIYVLGWVGEGAIIPNYRGASKRQTASQEPGGKQDQDTGDLFLILRP